jgi:hypothetical protein
MFNATLPRFQDFRVQRGLTLGSAAHGLSTGPLAERWFVQNATWLEKACRVSQHRALVKRSLRKCWERAYQHRGSSRSAPRSLKGSVKKAGLVIVQQTFASPRNEVSGSKTGCLDARRAETSQNSKINLSLALLDCPFQPPPPKRNHRPAHNSRGCGGMHTTL